MVCRTQPMSLLMSMFHSRDCMCLLIFFFFHDTATTEIYTLSLHDALPIYAGTPGDPCWPGPRERGSGRCWTPRSRDRKSTRLNSSHRTISYAVFCLKKKNETKRKELNMPTTITGDSS